jgi:hypothetical protein
VKAEGEVEVDVKGQGQGQDQDAPESYNDRHKSALVQLQ